MKRVEDVVACVCDYGTVICLAEILARTMKTVYYFSPSDREFTNMAESMIGQGVGNVERLNDIFPHIDEIDLFIFPDIGFAGLQKYLRSIGKAVWGSNGGDELERYRTFFLDIIEELGLPVINTERLVGLSALESHLQDVRDKWVKIDKFRGDMETWHHFDYVHSRGRLERLAVALGGAREYATFIVQDSIETDVEIGYDGWCIDGNYPPFALQGYEKKNKLYLGHIIPEADLAEEIVYIKEMIAPILGLYSYRNWVAMEARIAKGVPYFTDIGARFSGLASESVQEACTNFDEVVWYGANGIIVEPKFEWLFVSEAALHYDNDESATAAISKEWKVLEVPEEAKRWMKLSNYCEIDGVVHFVPNAKDELGVIIGVGDSVEESIEHLKGTLDLLSGLPIHADTKDFADLLKSIEEAEDEGIEFADEVPTPEAVFKDLA